MNTTVIRFLCFTLAWTVGMAAGVAADWPTYMHDPARSGVSSETLPLPLAELWTYTPPAESRLSERSGRALPEPREGELPKLDYDDATHVALAGDAVFFGSSVDNGIHALDAGTGTRRWSVFTEGPVRFAPTFVPSTTLGTMACLRLSGRGLSSVNLCSLTETNTGMRLRPSRNSVRLKLLPQQVLTLRLTTRGPEVCASLNFRARRVAGLAGPLIRKKP